MESVGIEMHGVRLNLQSSHSPIIEYAKEHLHHAPGTAHLHPHVTVNCLWTQGDWDETINPFPSNGRLNSIGRRMLGNAEELVWLNTLRMKGLQLRFSRRDGQNLFDVFYCYHPKKEKIQSLQRYEYRKYFSLMPYLVYFPIMWHLETECGWTFLHASALSFDRGSMMIAGLGGCGKTTTCVALMQQTGFELVSENMIFSDGEYIYPCYEPIRLNGDSLEMLCADDLPLKPMAFPEGLKEKSFFHFTLSEDVTRTKPVATFLPNFSSEPFVRQIPAQVAAAKLQAMNDLALELNDYNWYASALRMQWPSKNNRHKNPWNSLSELLERTRCFELGIDRKAGVSKVIQDILAKLWLWILSMAHFLKLQESIDCLEPFL